MRVSVNTTEYTQLNTVEDAYLLQNLGGTILYAVVSDDKPADDTKPDLKIKPLDALSSAMVIGKVWGKGSLSESIVGVIE